MEIVGTVEEIITTLSSLSTNNEPVAVLFFTKESFTQPNGAVPTAEQYSEVLKEIGYLEDWVDDLWTEMNYLVRDKLDKEKENE